MKKIGLLFLIMVILSSAFGVPQVFADANGDAQISGDFDGSAIVIKTSDWLAGAVSSLKWKGLEYVDSKDHGREIQYAWTFDSKGECNNPTEAGSSGGGNSKLISLTVNAPNKLSTISNPAFWEPPNFKNPNHNCSVSNGGNTTLVSDNTLKKTVTIGALGIPNLISFHGEITIPQGHQKINWETPTGYHNGVLSHFFTFDPESQKMEPVTLPGGYGTNTRVSSPAIIESTGDQGHAIGVFAPPMPGSNPPGGSYALFSWFTDLQKWSVNYPSAFTNTQPNTTYTFDTFIAIGTVDQVKTALHSANIKLSSPTPTPKPTPIPGDLTNVGDSPGDQVNINDYNILKGDFGKTGNPGWINSDINNDGKVNIFDFNILVGNFGK